MLNEKHRVSKEDSAIKSRHVEMGLANIMLTLKDDEIMQSQSSTDLRIDGFHAIVVVSTLIDFFPLFF